MPKVKRLTMNYNTSSPRYAVWRGQVPGHEFPGGRAILCCYTLNKMVKVDTSLPLDLCISKKRPAAGIDCLQFNLKNQYTECMTFIGDKEYKRRDIFRGLSLFCKYSELMEGFIWLEQ